MSDVISPRLFITKRACIRCGRPTKKGSFCKHCAEQIEAALDGTPMPRRFTRGF